MWFIGKLALPPRDLPALIGADVVGTYFQKNTGNEIPIRALSRRRPYHAGLAGRAHRFDIHAGGERPGAVPRGQVKAYAVMANKRWAAVPDIPTGDEGGVRMVCGPQRQRRGASLPHSMPRWWRPCRPLGQEPWPRDKQTPEALAVQQIAEIEKWWSIIKAAGVRAE